MPNVNLDMLKQLLDDFQEKEAQASEHIAASQQQIEELESRIETCKQRLQVVAADREKVVSIMQRWVKSDSSSDSASAQPMPPSKELAVSKTQPVAKANVFEKSQATAKPKDSSPFSKETAKPATVSKEVAKPTLQPKADLPVSKPISKPAATIKPAEPSIPPPPAVADEPLAPVAEAQPEAPEQKAADSADAQSEEGDTVKSINDALRGLFS